MATVVALDEFRRKKYAEKSQISFTRPRPRLAERDILSRDYTRFDHVVWAVVKVREVLDFHIYLNEVGDHLAFNFLEAACGLGGTGRDGEADELAVAEAAKPLKNYMMEEMTPGNKRDFSIALMLVELVERSPAARKRAARQAGL